MFLYLYWVWNTYVSSNYSDAEHLKYILRNMHLYDSSSAIICFFVKYIQTHFIICTLYVDKWCNGTKYRSQCCVWIFSIVVIRTNCMQDLIDWKIFDLHFSHMYIFLFLLKEFRILNKSFWRKILKENLNRSVTKSN